AAADRRPFVESAKQRRRVGGRDATDLAFDEASDEVALRLDERDDVRTDSEGRGSERCSVLDATVDTEQLGVLPADPEDERVAAGADLEVVVRDPAAERLRGLDPGGPHPLDDSLDHERTRSPRGSKSGSAATSPATHSPKISTSTGCPVSELAAGRYE